MKTKKDLNILLIQIRKDKMKEHEYDCILRYSGLAEHQLVSFDVFEDDFEKLDPKKYDAIIVGGSGEFCVDDAEIQEVNKKIGNVIRFCYENNHPFLGACYGGQLAAKTLGGGVVKDERYRETGTFEISAVEAAKGDLIFSALPERFFAQLGHKDSIETLPSGAILLARSERCPTQAFTFPGKKFYGIQFHPELNKEDVVLRVNYYAGYAKDRADVERIIAGLKDSPEAAKFLGLFLNRVVLGSF